jgi:transporter family-2 protein
MNAASLYTLAIVAGFGLTIQAGLNAMVRQGVGSAAGAALVNFLVGLIALACFVVAVRAPLPDRAALAGVPAWAWFGGLFGAFYVASVTIVGPRLGATVMIALTVAGQLLSSLLVDHNGWLGFPQEPISAQRILGAALVLGGVILVSR